MRALPSCVVVPVLFAALLPVAAAAGPLKAGVARVDITPPLGLTMYGYGGRKAGATGVRDPLMARVLVLEAGDTRIAFVGLDLGRATRARVGEAPARERLEVQRHLVRAGHGHAHAFGPRYPARVSRRDATRLGIRRARQDRPCHRRGTPACGRGADRHRLRAVCSSATTACDSNPTAASRGSSATTR